MNIDKKIEEYLLQIAERYWEDKFTVEGQKDIYELESEIMAVYGLPASFHYSTLMQEAAFDKTRSHVPVEEFMLKMEKMAAGFLLTKPEPDREILEKGKQLKTAYSDVLPYLGIETHSYCVFIYEELYCRSKITTEAALYALKAFKNETQNIIFNLFNGWNLYEAKLNFNVYRKLKKIKLPFLEQFVQHIIDVNMRSEADMVTWDSIFNKQKLDEEIDLTHFYITKVEYSDKSESYFLDIIYKVDHDWFALVVVCNRPLFEIILSQSRFGEQASLVRSNFESGVVTLDLKSDYDMRQLEIIGLTLELESMDDDLESYFTVGKFYTTAQNEGFQENQMDDIIDDLPF